MKCWNMAFPLSMNGCSCRSASPKVAGMNAPTPLATLADIDTDPQETTEWREAFAALVAAEGRSARASCSKSWRAWRASSAWAGSPT